MRFFAILPTILAIAASAPTSEGNARVLVKEVQDHAATAMKTIEASGCQKLSKIFKGSISLYLHKI